MKRMFSTLMAAGVLVFGVCLANAGDERYLEGQQMMAPPEFVMPALQPGEYGTDIDNENNAGTHVADGDMDTYLYKDSTVHPIEFNINIPINPANSVATLRMDVYDIDASSGEVDKVYVNNVYVGSLNGSDGVWGVNIFQIPIGTLKQGLNRVKIMVDVNSATPSWATQIDWGIIKVTTTPQISRAWFTPLNVARGGYINAFAEVSGLPASVKVFDATTVPHKLLFSLTDPDKDRTWSGQYQIPLAWTVGYKPNLRIKAYNAAGAIISQWPGITVK